MLPYKSLITIDRNHALPVFVQISNGIASLIRGGIIPKKTKLPGTRMLAQTLEVHRMTVVAAYDELLSQGWVESLPSKGTFVHSKLPLIEPQSLETLDETLKDKRQTAGFSIYKRNDLERDDVTDSGLLTIDDGIPDVRIAPVQEIARIYKNILSRDYNRKHLSYGSIYGDIQLRKFLVGYLNETRGLKITIDNILITRGSQMGIYLASNLILAKGDKAIVGESNYIAANLTLKDTHAQLIKVPVDEYGIDTKAVEKCCQRYPIKALYITPHHHHPTTVMLSAERRIHLLSLADRYGFAILEDDYDYDFHYQSNPLLPLASADQKNMVVYIGALSKIVAPSYRVGYMVGPTDLIQQTANLRRIIDRQGDAILEKVMVQMFIQGHIQRHTKKALKIYKSRRDLLAQLLSERLSKYISFTLPEGGMAFWVKIHPSIELTKLNSQAEKNGLKLPLWSNYDQDNIGHNCMRLGFASLNNEELVQAITLLERSFNELSDGK